ncbi:hypothetical protein CROQUDRAFT_653011 [Cronartium quercuum f. sp. fusiforme G11]|uniref:Uncharacterized protein n=1 Tax=Cronartium quercuum f. sp. fusiforme G11 TaxID=708437 RepID=A0A9P6TEX2_9BASI|nr:hypothetical protein CROQUDRAFT_653011 [Cronartium quercuum f. sp. fusiforme G11]
MIPKHLFTRIPLNIARHFPAQGRNYASTAAHSPHQKSSDAPWIISSTVVFGATLAYLLSPPKVTHAHHHEPSISVQSMPSAKDKDTPSFEESDIPRAGDPRVLESTPAGEGRPHGEGDKALRKMVQSTELHSDKQVTTGGLHEQKQMPEKMEHARSDSAKRGANSDSSLDTKTVVAKAKTDHQDKQENSRK